MSLKARVVNRFREKDHNDRIYELGETYPAEGYESNDERIYFLSEIHPTFQKIFLADIQKVESVDTSSVDSQHDSDKPQDTEEKSFPNHVGGGMYELSNGEKVKGKEEAQEAEAALKE